MEPEGEHSHCLTCVTTYCKANAKCPVEYCKNSCGSSLHRCKWPDHDREICPEALVNCTNFSYGCEEKIRRKDLSAHILHCPASTVYCRFVYSRYVATSRGELDQKEVDRLIDVQLLEGDAELMRDWCSSPTSCLALGLLIENISYALRCRRPRDSNSGAAPLVPTNQRFCRAEQEQCYFHCNQTVRRDEFQAHWNYHMVVQIGPLVERCALGIFGCTHGQQFLAPSPPGTTLSFNSETDSFSALSSPHPSTDESTQASLSRYEAKIKEKEELAQYGYGSDEDESFDVLGQLPLQVLLIIFRYLDSISLSCTSMVNHYFRKVCFEILAKKRGIIYHRWIKDPNAAWIPLQVLILG